MVIKGANLSGNRKYRYKLWRTWDANLPTVNFVMLNPSTADENVDDPTIRKCSSYARRWGYGGIVVTNLFALRSVSPDRLYNTRNPIGVSSNRRLIIEATAAKITICAWGNHGNWNGRSAIVVKMLREAGIDLMCLRCNGGGEPAHPLYLPLNLVPVPFGG